MRANALALNETIVPSSSEWACRKKFALQIRTTATPPHSHKLKICGIPIFLLVGTYLSRICSNEFSNIPPKLRSLNAAYAQEKCV